VQPGIGVRPHLPSIFESTGTHEQIRPLPAIPSDVANAGLPFEKPHEKTQPRAFERPEPQGVIASVQKTSKAKEMAESSSNPLRSAAPRESGNAPSIAGSAEDRASQSKALDRNKARTSIHPEVQIIALPVQTKLEARSLEAPVGREENPKPVLSGSVPASTSFPEVSNRREPLLRREDQSHRDPENSDSKLAQETIPVLIERASPPERAIAPRKHSTEPQVMERRDFGEKRNLDKAASKPLIQPAVRPAIAPTREQIVSTSTPAPTIHVTIGRVEVRAVQEQPSARRPPSRPAVMGLDEYLKRRAS
jgi:hypothetical protein